MLQALRERPYFERFRRGLPSIGRSGTLRYRLRGTAAQGRVRAKTGTLFTPSVKTLAGYVTPRGGAGTTNRVLVFATLHNGIDRDRAVAIQDRVAFLLATRGASGTPVVIADPPAVRTRS
jgi:D-alanyl-D-alanine carboxypeptidase/D-alanyl-D-alanine-endopeptidase (penicillin-binding protein 4)